MTEVAVDWVTLSTPEFVAWTRFAGLTLPFPLSSGGLGFVDGPDEAALDRALAARELAGSPVLAATRAAFAQPRLSVYAVRATLPDAAETKYLSVAGHDDRAVLVLLDAHKVAIREIADTELAAGVVGALPPLTPLPCQPCEVTLSGLREIDTAIEQQVSPRTLRAQMSHLGLGGEIITLRERTGNNPGTSGAIGAMAYPSAHESEPVPRHSALSASWREYHDGALLMVEREPQRGEPMVLLTAATQDALFRAAVDAVASCYAGDGS